MINVTSMEAADPPRSPSGSAGAQATAAGGDRPIRWEALLINPGLLSNRCFYTHRVLKEALPLFVGAPVRIARHVRFGHGVRSARTLTGDLLRASAESPFHREHLHEQTVGLYRAGCLERVIEIRIATDAIAPTIEASEPAPIGRVVDAAYDPWTGVVGTIELDAVAVEDNVFAQVGLLSPTEFVPDGFVRLSRAGLSHVLRISTVPRAYSVDGTGTDGLPCETITSVTSIDAVDVVLLAASDAHLIRPLPKSTRPEERQC